MAETKVINLADLGVIVTDDIKKAVDAIEVTAGILQESLYKNGTSLQKVASLLEEKYGWIERGIGTKDNNDLRRAVDIVVKGLATGHFTEQQFINAVKATFVNPINRREFGSNAPSTVAKKGFDKCMVDTGKFIKAINATMTRSTDVS